MEWLVKARNNQDATRCKSRFASQQFCSSSVAVVDPGYPSDEKAGKMKAVQSGAGRVPSIRLRCSSCATCRQRPPTRCAKQRHSCDSGPGARQQPELGLVVSGGYDARKPSSTSNEAGLGIAATQIAGKAVGNTLLLLLLL